MEKKTLLSGKWWRRNTVQHYKKVRDSVSSLVNLGGGGGGGGGGQC